MARSKKQQTAIPGFGCIFQKTYNYKGEKRRSRTWYIEFKAADGHPVQRSTGLTDPAAAYAELMKLAGKTASGEIQTAKSQKGTIGELLDMLLSHYRKNRRTARDVEFRVEKRLRPAFGTMRTSALRFTDLEQFVASLRRGKLENSSINRYLANLHKALKLGEQAELVGKIPPFPWQSEDNVREGVFTDAMYIAIRDELAPHARLAFVIAYHTGMRKGAILSLRRDWIDLEAGVIRIPSPAKGSTKRNPRNVPIWGEMRGYLEMAMAERTKCPYLIQYEGSAVREIRTAWNAACRRAGIAMALFHDTRRTVITRMEEAGVPRHAAMAASGHKTESAYKRYAIGSQRVAQQTGRQMEEWLAKQDEAPAAGNGTDAMKAHSYRRVVS